MPKEPLAFVRITLAEAAPEFAEAAVDLLCEVENADPALVTDAVLAAARELRSVIERGGW